MTTTKKVSVVVLAQKKAIILLAGAGAVSAAGTGVAATAVLSPRARLHRLENKLGYILQVCLTNNHIGNAVTTRVSSTTMMLTPTASPHTHLHRQPSGDRTKQSPTPGPSLPSWLQTRTCRLSVWQTSRPTLASTSLPLRLPNSRSSFRWLKCAQCIRNHPGGRRYRPVEQGGHGRERARDGSRSV